MLGFLYKKHPGRKAAPGKELGRIYLSAFQMGLPMASMD